MNLVSLPVLRVDHVQKRYPVKRLLRTVGSVKALSGISFALNRGETLAVVGESGCGKSTLAKLLMKIESPTEGGIFLGGTEIQNFSRMELLKEIQMIFQDPYGSLNPRKKAWQIISEPLMINTKLSRQECRDRAEAMMVKVGLGPEYADRYPHMFSGGQRQRIGIARALIMKPKVLVCDEPVSALDVSVQAQILNLLLRLQREMGLSYIFISHDLSVVRHIADRVLVVYLGKVVESGTADEIFQNPQHPYTQSLLDSTPTIPPRSTHANAITGEIPSPMKLPTGCAFHTRCPRAQDNCRRDVPVLEARTKTHMVSCLLTNS